MEWKSLFHVTCNPMDCTVHGILQNTGVGSHSLLQGIFPTQGSNPGLPHCRWILYHLSHQGSPYIYRCVYIYIYTHTYIIYTHTHNLSFFKHLRKSSRLWSFIPKYLSIYFLRIGHNYTIVIKVRKLMLILTAELKDIELIWSANKCKTDEVKHWE